MKLRRPSKPGTESAVDSAPSPCLLRQSLNRLLRRQSTKSGRRRFNPQRGAEGNVGGSNAARLIGMHPRPASANRPCDFMSRQVLGLPSPDAS